MTQEAITSYDAMGREVSSTDQNTGEVTTTTYDFMGRVVKTERSLTDQEGNKTSQTETKSYNANGAVTSETSSAGVTTEYRYDSRNRVTTTKEDADNTTKTTETSYGYETAVIHTLTGTKTYKDLQVQTTKVNGTVTEDMDRSCRQCGPYLKQRYLYGSCLYRRWKRDRSGYP